MTSRLRRGASARQRGVAMVEFAIVTPLILLLILGVSEIGRAIVFYNALTKSLEVGARHAAAYGILGTTGNVSIDAALNNEIRNLVVYGDAQGGSTPVIQGLATNQVTVTVPVAGQIRVAAVYPYTPMLGAAIPSFGYGDDVGMNFSLTAAVTMRAL